MKEILTDIIDWSNQNSGFLGLIIFIISLIIGWLSGLFNYFRKKPKFKIRIIETATFGTIIDLKKTYNNLPVNKTAFAIYLEVSNVGNAPSSIGKISLGYLLSDLRPKWRTSRIWLPETFSKSDFRVEFRESKIVKGFPFLKQKNESFINNVDTYLEIGKTAIGIVYFEQEEAYGSYMPRFNKDKETTDLLIKMEDSYGKIHKKKFKLKLVDTEYSLKLNSFFGQTQYEYFIEEDKEAQNKE
jgi:hypothetical protein